MKKFSLRFLLVSAVAYAVMLIPIGAYGIMMIVEGRGNEKLAPWLIIALFSMHVQVVMSLLLVAIAFRRAVWAGLRDMWNQAGDL